jgi:hypothetical protein
VPSANTLVRWVNENAFASIMQARPCPTFGRPVHLRGSPHRLRPGTSPHALRIPPHGGHPALRSYCEWGFRSALAVSGFRFRARLGFSIPSSSLRPTRHYPRFWIRRPSSERRRDFNPPEQCAAQRTLCLRSDSREDQDLDTQIGETFATMFSRDNSLDILFLNSDEESRLIRVCTPFYNH